MQILIGQNKKEIKQHGDFGFPVNISVESIQQYEQGMFLWHWHPEIELTWIMEGELEYHVNDAIYHLKAGEGLFGNSNTLHAGFQEEGRNCSYLSITFHPRFLYGYEGSCLQTKYMDFITGSEARSSLKLAPSVSWQKRILDSMKEIYAVSREHPSDYELRVHLLLTEIWQQFFLYFYHQPESELKPQKGIQRLRDMLSYIQEHYTEDITLEDVAAQVNICKSECCRFFKKYMNMKIFDYILFLRIHNSLTYLKQGESITRTASLCGFSNAAYYGQIFRRFMKCTPSQYRAQNRDNL